MAVSMPELLADLRAETGELLAMVRTLDDAGWATPTPAEGWAVRDQIGHLAWFDDAATTAVTDPDAFLESRAALMTSGEEAVDALVAASRGLTPAQVLDWFTTARQRLMDALEAVDARTRFPWYGPDMSAASFVTARLMETWAHGQDVADALGVTRIPTMRLRHVARLGVLALPYGFALRGLPVPEQPVRVELTAPDGSTWTSGEGENVVRGPMLDFCLVVTQRVNLADTALEVTGEAARAWMAIAQAFAGPPGKGRPAGSRTRT